MAVILFVFIIFPCHCAVYMYKIMIVRKPLSEFPPSHWSYCWNRHSGSVVERPLCDREVAGSIPGRVIPKTLKMVLAALSLGAQHLESRVRNRNWSAQCQYNVTGWNIMSKCLGMIFQWGSTLKVSIELPVTSRHRRDMTEDCWKRR